MKWITDFKAIEIESGLLKNYSGETIEAPSYEMALKWCRENKPWLNVLGRLVMVIPCKDGTIEPDFDNATDYDAIQNN